MDPVIAAGLLELAKVGIQSVFTLLRMTGKTEAEIDLFLADQKAYFDAHPPESLPDV
jgi:hypothetical protein